MERDYTFTQISGYWTAVWRSRFECESLKEIYMWCEAQWGHQYKNQRWKYATSSHNIARITIMRPDDAFAFKMRWY